MRSRRDGALDSALGSLEKLATVPGDNDRADTPDQHVTALRRLPARRRQVVFLRYFADLSYAAIAELAGISEGTVAATLAQAHDALRHELESQEVPHEAR